MVSRTTSRSKVNPAYYFTSSAISESRVKSKLKYSLIRRGEFYSEDITSSTFGAFVSIFGDFLSTNETHSEVFTDVRTFDYDPRMFDKSQNVFIYDRDEELTLILSDDTIPYTGHLDEELNGTLTLELEVIADDPQVDAIENDGRIVTRNADGEFMEFIIREVKDVDGSSGTIKDIYAEGGEYELIDEFLTGYTASDVEIGEALETILEGARWDVGKVESFIGSQSIDLENMSKKKAIYELLNQYDCDIKYRIEINGNKIINRYVDIMKNRGEDNGKRFEDTKDILSTTRTLDSTQVKTAMYGRGASGVIYENEDVRLDFGDIEWKEEDGDPVDKPKGQTWVGDPDALDKWGYGKGTRHRFGFYDGQEEDPAVLLLNTWKELQKTNDANNTYEFDVIYLSTIMDIPHEDIRLGDTVYAINRRISPDVQVKLSVIEYNHNLNDPKLSTVTLGHFRHEYDLSEKVNDIEKDYNGSRGMYEGKPSKKDVDEEVRSLDDKVSEELEDTKESIKEAEERIEQGKKDIDDAKKELKKLDGRLEDADKEIDDTKDRMDDLDDNLEEADKEISGTKDRLDELDERLKDADKDISGTKDRLDELGDSLKKADDRIEDAYGDLDDLDKALDDKIPIGMAAEDVNEGNTEILGKNLVIDGNTTVTGTIGASKATFKDLTTRNMDAIDATIEDATITGEIEGKDAIFQGIETDKMTAINATIEDATITGEIEGKDATFQGIKTKEMTAIDATIEDATITGEIEGRSAVFQGIETNNMTAIDATIEDATITGEISGRNATFMDITTENMTAVDATIKDAVITGQLDGVDGTFVGKLEGVDGTFTGTVTAENIKGNKISGVTFDTGTYNDARINMEEQNITFYQGGSSPAGQQNKLHIGFRNESGSAVNKPYMIWGYGKANGRSKMVMEKDSNHFLQQYTARNGNSELKFNYSGSTALKADKILHLSSGEYVNSNEAIHAPDFKNSSRRDLKTNIEDFVGPAMDIINNTKVYKYNLKKDVEKTNSNGLNGVNNGEGDQGDDVVIREFIGLMADEAEAVGDGESISLYKAISVLWKANQELCDRLDELEG